MSLRIDLNNASTVVFDKGPEAHFVPTGGSPSEGHWWLAFLDTSDVATALSHHDRKRPCMPTLTRSSFRTAVTIVLSGGLLSACSLVNPHVTWQRTPNPSTLQDGIDYADRAKDAYKKAIGDQATLTNAMALGLIPLGAAALGLGVTQGSGAAIAALGLAGGAGFASGSWLSSRPRQFVYIAGIKAMTCAVDAMLPLKFSPAALADYKGNLTALNTSKDAFALQIALVKGLLERARKEAPEESALIADTGQDLQTAESLLETANSVYGSGTLLEREIDRAAATLISAVDRLAAEVDRAIVATLPDIQTLPAIIGGLAQMSGQFGKLPEAKSGEDMSGTTPKKPKEGPEATTPTKPVVDELNKEKVELKRQAMILGPRIRAVSAVVNAVSDAKPAATLKQCGVDEVDIGLSVLPTTPVEFEKGKAATTRLLISGGKSPYFAELLEEPVEGLKVSQPVTFGPRVLIEMTSAAKAGKYTVLITDTAKNTKVVGATIKEPLSSAPSSPPAKPAAPAAAVTPEDQAQIKQALCVPKEEAFDSPRMKAAIKNFQETLGLPVGELTAEQVTILKAQKACQAGRTNFFENTLTDTRMLNLQEKLGVPKTGTLDSPTRAAVKAFATAQQLEPNDGTLTKSLADKIEK